MFKKCLLWRITELQGLWSVFFPAYEQMRRELVAGTIGEVRHVGGSLGIEIDSHLLNDPSVGGGAVLGFGCYVTMILCMIYGQRPERIHASGTLQGGAYFVQWLCLLNGTTTLDEKYCLLPSINILDIAANVLPPCSRYSVPSNKPDFTLSE